MNSFRPIHSAAATWRQAASIRPSANLMTRLFAAGTAVGVGYTMFVANNTPLRLESTKSLTTSQTLSFPKTMLISKQLKVVSSEYVNHDTKLITFALPGGESETSGLPPGAAILTQHTPSGSWIPVFRPYTPIHNLDEPGVLQLLVKKYPGGKASSHMHSLAPGEELTVRGPIPSYYKWKPSTKPRDVVFIAGGAGITPIYSLARGVLKEDQQTRIHLLWGVNSSRDVLLQQQIGELKKIAGDALQITYFVSGPKGVAEIEEAKVTTPVPADFKPGRITEGALSQLMNSVGGKDRLGDEQGIKVFMCGPPSMEDALAGKNGVLTQLGISKKEIHRF